MRLISNYHTHTQLCNHAKGMPQDYAEQALKDGCLELGFSDHCPYPENFNDIWPDIRMKTEDIPLYKSCVQQVKDNFPFKVYLGFECEFDKNYEGWYQDLKGIYGAEYLVLGSHWVTDSSNHVYIPEVSTTKLLNKYIDQTIDGMKSGCFDFIAHPDLFMMGYKEWDEQSKSCLNAIADAALDLNIPLEINGLGTTRTPINTSKGMRYPYPYIEFWEMVKEKGCKVICNSDAHNPQDILLNAWKAIDFASRFSLNPIHKLDI